MHNLVQIESDNSLARDMSSHAVISMSPEKVVTSENPQNNSSFTEFMFDAPVYIQPGVLYAFIVKSSSTDYNLWLAGQNQTAIASSTKANPNDPNPTTTTKIGTAPYVGAIFESQNAITWTADQTKDLMFTIDRCKFDITKTPNTEEIIKKCGNQPITLKKQNNTRLSRKNTIRKEYGDTILKYFHNRESEYPLFFNNLKNKNI